MTGSKKLVVIGQGYVGLPLAVRGVEAGYDVVGIEIDQARVARLQAADSYVEDIPDDVLREALATGRYLATNDYAHCSDFDVAVISVPTPLRDGVPDLSFIEESGATLAPHVRRGSVVVLESTTYPGTTEELLAPALEAGSGLKAGIDFHLGYSPERIDPGNPTWGLVNTPKVVSGVDPASLRAVQSFYDEIVDHTVAVSSPKEAELTKLLENTFRHVNIALVNELAMFASDLGIDIWEAIDAASTKPFGFMRFTPGPGVGGHCLPVDPSYLSWQVRQTLGRPFRFVELANDVNDHMPDYVVQRATELLNRERKAVNGASILVLGLAYKRNTGDARESPSLRVVQLLVGLGAEVLVADPHVGPESLDRFARMGATHVTDAVEHASAAELIILLTDHDDFDYDALAQHGHRILDTRRRIAEAHSL